MAHDPINKPSHYMSHNEAIECIDVIEAFSSDGGYGFCVGNAIKYLCRADKKNADGPQEDLAKAQWYVARALKGFGVAPVNEQHAVVGLSKQLDELQSENDDFTQYCVAQRDSFNKALAESEQKLAALALSNIELTAKVGDLQRQRNVAWNDVESLTLELKALHKSMRGLDIKKYDELLAALKEVYAAVTSKAGNTDAFDEMNKAMIVFMLTTVLSRHGVEL